VKENAVPDTCDILIDRRLLPGETAEGERQIIESRLEPIRRDYGRFTFTVSTQFAVEAAELDPQSEFAQHVSAAAQAVTGSPTEIWGAPFGSDVGSLVSDGIEAVTFGPGNVEECHCPDERVSIKQIVDASVTIAKVVTDLLVEERAPARSPAGESGEAGAGG
jgi:acetylornithine deacetylase/succinyl-diaminopimelate desuccinylase-like protein